MWAAGPRRLSIFHSKGQENQQLTWTTMHQLCLIYMTGTLVVQLRSDAILNHVTRTSRFRHLEPRQSGAPTHCLLLLTEHQPHQPAL